MKRYTWIVAFLLLAMPTHGIAQLNRPIITVDNVRRLVPVATFEDEWFGGVAWSPDGASLAIGSRWNVKLMDTSSMVALETLGKDRCYVETVAFTPDNSTIISGDQCFRIERWLIVENERAAMFHLYPYFDLDRDSLNVIRDLAINPDGTLLAVTDHDSGAIWLASLPDLHDNMYLVPEADRINYANSVAFSPNGAWLALGNHVGTIHIWNVATEWEWRNGIAELGDVMVVRQGNEQSILEHGWGVTSVVFSPDSRYLASGAYFDERIIVWDVATQTRVATLAGHSDRGVIDITFSPDGQLLVAIDVAGMIHVWSMTEFERVATFDAHDSGEAHVAVHPDGTLLASSGGDGKLIVWGIAPE